MVRLTVTVVVAAVVVAGLATAPEAGSRQQEWTASWTHTSNRAPDRERAASTFLPTVCQAIEYGGAGQVGIPTGNTFIYTPAEDSWEELAVKKGTPGPGARTFSRLTWDPERGVAVLFGGFGSAGILRDSWVFDPATRKWAQAVTSCKAEGSCPPARYMHVQAWSNDVGRTFVFGGKTNPSIYYGDLWALDTKVGRKGALTWYWSRLDPEPDPDDGVPAPRSQLGMAELQDGPDAGKLLIYGGARELGATDSAVYRDTWLYDPILNAFERVHTDAPTASWGFAMGYAPALGSVVITGGGKGASDDPVEETWAFDADNRMWVQVNTAGQEPTSPRFYGEDLVSDPSGHCGDEAFLFGAPVNSSGADYTWILRHD